MAEIKKETKNKKYKVEELFKKHMEKKKHYLLPAFCVYAGVKESDEIDETEFMKKIKSFKNRKII